MSAPSPTSPDDPIKHVVLLMLENRSFDQMLGIFKTKYPDDPLFEGIDARQPPRTNVDHDGRVYEQRPTTQRETSPDPKHELEHTLTQIGYPEEAHGGPGRERGLWARVFELLLAGMELVVRLVLWVFGLVKSLWYWVFPRREQQPARKSALYQPDRAVMQNFVLDYSRAYPQTTEEQRQQIMGYYDLGELPALHALADDFTICDRWFSSVPGPTWTNRFFAHSGTSLGIVRMPEGEADLSEIALYDQTTVFDRLNEQDISWRVYYGDVPHTMLLANQWKHFLSRYYKLNKLVQHTRDYRSEEDFPAYTVIEPEFLGADANDDHPPRDIMRAQALIADVYNALRANAKLWKSTLLVVLYDEHGGFYDHMPPPPAAPPDDYQTEYTFDRLGVRVPALLVSPWVARGVNHTMFDHTSVLRYLTDKWDLGPLGSRVSQAASFAAAIHTSGAPRTDTVEHISVPPLRKSATYLPTEHLAPPLNDLERALIGASERLEAQSDDGPPDDRQRLTPQGPDAQRRAAAERVRQAVERAHERASQARSPLDE